MRLIDADALKEFYGKWSNKHTEFLKPEVDHYIDQQPTIDAVPVVRCKDCKDAGERVGDESVLCRSAGCLMGLDAFCSYGERKEAEIDG